MLWWKWPLNRHSSQATLSAVTERTELLGGAPCSIAGVHLWVMDTQKLFDDSEDP